MNHPTNSSNQLSMGLRCKDGDMAVIVGDVAGCEGNIGCVVEVRGPPIELCGFICWKIKPLNNRKILVREFDGLMFNGLIVEEKVFWNSKVSHPDCFLLPIRPPADDQHIETIDTLKIERSSHANV